LGNGRRRGRKKREISGNTTKKNKWKTNAGTTQSNTRNNENGFESNYLVTV
jgi:hypothetical protein